MNVDGNIVENVKNLVDNIEILSNIIINYDKIIEIQKNAQEATTKITKELARLEQENPQLYEDTLIALQEYDRALKQQQEMGEQTAFLPAIAIPSLVYELLISAGIITTTIVATKDARNNSVDGIMGNESGININPVDYRDNPKQKVRTANEGDYVQTPLDEKGKIRAGFTKNGANYRNNKTGEIWQKEDNNGHYGEDGWKVGNKKNQEPARGNKTTVDKNGKIIKKDK
ncbi:hypothetical protein [Halarcobacter ebronensis]|uniref:Uncharacterized protein n=1 Tax=Halarcobacter ebronensis TaxID=1462615 RepID=A0A4Q1ANE4_9BACT|nr:hypothetical protein [Halarcobacter ebronensis]QKF82605.1 hypothetical protein AEBR_2128 [Halarcobacter ebronensis]RXK07387.1 hypothetical protein CRV07_02670 [Halarcobacter ebronensis]